MTLILSLLVGSLIGLVLGLTGAGGAIFALPLLILLLGVTPQEAVGMALCVVAASTIFGVLTRLKSREIVWLHEWPWNMRDQPFLNTLIKRNADLYSIWHVNGGRVALCFLKPSFKKAQQN